MSSMYRVIQPKFMPIYPAPALPQYNVSVRSTEYGQDCYILEWLRNPPPRAFPDIHRTFILLYQAVTAVPRILWLLRLLPLLLLTLRLRPQCGHAVHAHTTLGTCCPVTHTYARWRRYAERVIASRFRGRNAE
jgi:hypothetical protein